MIRAISAWVLVSPAVIVAFVSYVARAAFRNDWNKRVVVAKIARWKWANRYANAIEKLTGYKF